MPERKVPVRQCVACRTHREKTALIRVVRSPEGAVNLDSVGKKPGRGAYLCRQPECLKKARKIRALERAFGVNLPDEVFDALTLQMEALADERPSDTTQG